MNKTRTIIIDGIEIQTSLTGVEIAGLVQRNKELQQQCKKQKEVISRAIELLNNPWSFESGNKEIDEITYNKKRKVIDILEEVSE